MSEELGLYLRTLEERLNPTALFERVVGGPCDPWQRQLLTTKSEFTMCLASRRIGKSQTTGVLAAQTVAAPDRTVLIISPIGMEVRSGPEAPIYLICTNVHIVPFS